MYCKSCGSENDDVARFCKDCGRAITGPSPSREGVAPADGGDTPDADEAPTKPNTWIWIAGGAGLVAVLLVAGLIVLALEVASEIADSSFETDREASAVFFEAPDDTGPPAPENVRYIWDSSTIVVTWDASEGAEYYTVYHDDFFDSSCRVTRDGASAFCEELSTNIRENSYVHTEPDGEENHYWVAACNRDGCSDIDSDSPAEYIDTRPGSPANVRVRFAPDGTGIQVSWDPVPDVAHYRIYYDDFFGDNCRVDRFGDASFCDLLASDIRQTSYLHTDPDRDENYYWVVACNSGGCSDVDRENPAVPADSSRSATAPTVSPSPGPSGTPTEPDASRKSFEASTPPGYTRVMLTDQGSVWGTPERFTTDSRLGAVAYMLLGSVGGCSFAREELKRSGIVYVKGERLGRLATYESGEACGKTSRTWDTGWEGLRITRLRIFDESRPANVREYVYDPDDGRYVESPASGGSN